MMNVELLPEHPDPVAVRRTVDTLIPLLKRGMDIIIARFASDPKYQWIDTKFNCATGEDFPNDDPIRGKSIVYSWIQGRGLESVAKHLRFFGALAKDKMLSEVDGRFFEGCRRILFHVSGRVLEAKRKGKGHVYFALTPEGVPLELRKEGVFQPKKTLSDCFTLSDIFCSRGLLSSAIVLNDSFLLDESITYCMDLCEAVWDGRYRSDQEQFDAKNPVKPVSGRNSHAPYMLQIPTMELLASQHVAGALEAAFEIIEHIVDHHVIVKPGDAAGLQEWDFVEFITDSGKPYEENGVIISDPGHALEFVGLAAQFCSVVMDADSATKGEKEEALRIAQLLPKIFIRNFTNGFDHRHGGIVKLWDLVARKPVNADLPWWSIIEAMRAAIGCIPFTSDVAEQSLLYNAYGSCFNALFLHYVSDKSGFCIQARDEKGNISDTIPAVPDADPNYHTGLPLIFCCEKITGL